jgi:CII-binding regulator of phage lambda lysogenization HflD
MSNQPTTGGHDHGHTDHAAPHAQSDNDELEGIKMVALESAELATRSANLAVGAGENMKKATHNLEELMKVNKKQHQILLGIAGGLMFITAIVFATSIFTLKSRINQMDAMLASLSKRVVELNDSVEMVGSVNEGLQAMVAKQDDISKMQGSLEKRLNEAIKNTESVPEKTAQQVGEKGLVLAAQVKSLEGRFVQQSKALNALATQVGGLQGAVGETGTFKKEMETLARLQRERQATENTVTIKAAASNNAANQAALAAAKQRERMVQYPRAQQETNPVGASGVLSSKP